MEMSGNSVDLSGTVTVLSRFEDHKRSTSLSQNVPG